MSARLRPFFPQTPEASTHLASTPRRTRLAPGWRRGKDPRLGRAPTVRTPRRPWPSRSETGALGSSRASRARRPGLQAPSLLTRSWRSVRTGAPHGRTTRARPRRAALRPALARRGELGAHSSRRRSFATLAAILPQPHSLPLRPGGRAEAAPTRAPPPSGGLGRRLPPRAECGSYLVLASWVADATAPVLFKLSLTVRPAPAALPPAGAATAAIAHSAWSVTASLPLPRARGLCLRRGKGQGAGREANPATPAPRRSGCTVLADGRNLSPRGCDAR